MAVRSSALGRGRCFGGIRPSSRTLAMLSLGTSGLSVPSSRNISMGGLPLERAPVWHIAQLFVKALRALESTPAFGLVGLAGLGASAGLALFGEGGGGGGGTGLASTLGAGISGQ